MSNTYQQYQARNELGVIGTDDNVLCAELSSGHSLLRPIVSGSNWTTMNIVLRFALSGSPGNGGDDMAGGYFFIGLCSGDKRFSQTGSAVGTHCIGLFSNNSNAVAAFTNTALSAKTAPPNTNIAQQRTGYLGVNTTGSYRVSSVGYNLNFSRYETQWSGSDAGFPTPNPVGNNFGILALEITKGASSWVLKGGANQFTVLGSSSFHIPVDNLKAAVFTLSGVTTAGRDAFTELPYYYFGASTNYWQQAWNTITLTPGPNEATFGYFDTFDIYYRNDQYPNSKLLIKDVILVRRS